MADKPKTAVAADDRDDATKRLTSHLNAFTLPEEAAQLEADEAVKLEEIELPSDVKKVLEMLREAQELSANTRTNAAIRHHRITKISAHLHRIQQVTPAPVMTSGNTAKLKDIQNEHAINLHVEELCRKDPMLRGYIAGLKSEIETLKQPKKNKP